MQQNRFGRSRVGSTRTTLGVLTAAVAATAALALGTPTAAAAPADTPPTTAAIDPSTVASTPAAIDPSVADATTRAGSAVQRANRIRTQVTALRLQAANATEDYDAAQDKLAAIVADHVEAQAQADNDQHNSTEKTDIVDGRVRALYMGGGPAGLLTSVFASKDLDDAANRVQTVTDLVDDGRTVAARSDVTAEQSAAHGERLHKLALRQIQLQKASADAASRVRDALRQSRAALDGADAEVQTLVAQQQQAERAAAERAFQAKLAAARAVAKTEAAANAAAARLATDPGAAAAIAVPGFDFAGLPAPAGAAAAAIAAARTKLGVPYVWGATGPDTFDCSGLTGWAYRQAGVSLPRTSREQWYSGTHVSMADLAPGDLLFWASNTDNPGTIHHVALYIGDGNMIAAPETGDVVKVQPVFLGGYIGAVRPT